MTPFLKKIIVFVDVRFVQNISQAWRQCWQRVHWKTQLQILILRHLFYIKKCWIWSSEWVEGAKACVGDTKALNVASCFTNESMFSTINQKACSCCCNPLKAKQRRGRAKRRIWSTFLHSQYNWAAWLILDLSGKTRSQQMLYRGHAQICFFFSSSIKVSLWCWARAPARLVMTVSLLSTGGEAGASTSN